MSILDFVYNLFLYFPQFAHYKDEMYITAQRTFGITPDRHYRLLHAASEEKPKIIVLSVIVQEAEGLEAKDANGLLNVFHPNSNLLNVLWPTILIFVLIVILISSKAKR
jgi:hypothetical protein